MNPLDAPDLQRRYAEQVQQLTGQYDHRVAHLSASLGHAILTLAADEPLRAIKRGGRNEDDQTVQAFVTQRLEELLRAAVHDERELLLKETLKKLAEAQTRVKELECNQHQGAAATFELTHRSALTQTHSAAHIARLDGQLKDAIREAEIARQSETVYRDQVQALQHHAVTTSRKLETLLKEHAALQLQKQHASEQMALAEAHAKEAELMAQLVEKKAKARLAAREKELQDELASMRAELQRAQKDARRTLEHQLRELKSTSTHQGLITLNELKLEYDQRMRKQADEYHAKVERLDQARREVERHAADELKRVQVLYGEERNTLVEQHRQAVDALKAAHAQEVTGLKQSHTLEIDQAEDRIQHLLQRHSQVAEEKEKAHAQNEQEKRKLDRASEERANELQSTNRQLQDQVASLQGQLTVATAVKSHMDQSSLVHADEWRALQARYAETVTRYQTVSGQHQQATTLVHALTSERDDLKQKYLSLGARMEKVMHSVEVGLAQSLNDEKEKRRRVKAEYEEQRRRWKEEKRAMLETISHQERKVIDLTTLSERVEEKCAEVVRHEQQMQLDREEERRQSQLTITQLQQDVQTLQSHRKQVETQLAEKLFHIDKLMVERTHVTDFQHQAASSVNREKGASVQAIEHEFNLRAEKMRHDMEQQRKDLDVVVHKLKMQHELEKADLWTEAQKQMDGKLHDLRASMFNEDQFKLHVSAEVDARVAAISKTLVHPHQHEAIVASKVDAARAQANLDYEIARDEWRKRQEDALEQAEARHRMKQDELKLRYENEYTAYATGLKQSVEDAEERVQRERQQSAEQVQRLGQLESDLRTTTSQLRECEARLEAKQHDEARFLSHISAQSGVIEKLKQMCDEEKARVNDLPAAERKALQQELEEAQKRFTTERQLLMRNHQEQLETLQSMRSADAQLLTQLHAQRDARDREHRQREDGLLAEHRAALDAASQRHAAALSALESQHKSLWRQRESTWSSEVSAREELLEKKVAAWEDAYKTELAEREKKVAQLTTDLRQTKERKDVLEGEVQQLQRQLNDTASVLENQSAKLARTSTQIRATELENSNGY